MEWLIWGIPIIVIATIILIVSLCYCWQKYCHKQRNTTHRVPHIHSENQSIISRNSYSHASVVNEAKPFPRQTFRSSFNENTIKPTTEKQFHSFKNEDFSISSQPRKQFRPIERSQQIQARKQTPQSIENKKLKLKVIRKVPISSGLSRKHFGALPLNKKKAIAISSKRSKVVKNTVFEKRHNFLLECERQNKKRTTIVRISSEPLKTFLCSLENETWNGKSLGKRYALFQANEHFMKQSLKLKEGDVIFI